MLKGALPLVFAVVVSVPVSGGDLNPPPGPVTPTMQTLEAFAPSTPVNSLPGSADAVFVIGASGRYHLTGDIDASGPGRFAILVTAPFAEIDLNGHEIRGGLVETRPMILASGSLVLRDGVVSNWGANGLDIAGGLSVEGVRFEGVQGNAVFGGTTGRFVGCVFEGCGRLVLSDGGSVVSCSFVGMDSAINAPNADGVVLADSSFRGTGLDDAGDVIRLGDEATLRGVTVANSGRTGLRAGDHASVIGCVFSGVDTGSNTGVIVGNNSIVDRCTVRDYGGSGVSAASICVVTGNSISTNGLHGVVFTGTRNAAEGNNVSSSGGAGIVTGLSARIAGNAISSGATWGIEVDDDCLVVGNMLDNDAILVAGDDSTIDGNQVNDTGSFAVRVEGDNNRVTRNTLGNQVFSLGSQNMIGVVRTFADFSAAGPWDNFLQP